MSASVIPNRLFGVPCGERFFVTSDVCCGHCGAAGPAGFWGVATARFQIMDGVLRRYFAWEKNPLCECVTDGIWLSDGPTNGEFQDEAHG